MSSLGSQFKKDRDKVEHVQRTAARMAKGLESKPFQERLKDLSTPSLVCRIREVTLTEMRKDRSLGKGGCYERFLRLECPDNVRKQIRQAPPWRAEV